MKTEGKQVIPIDLDAPGAPASLREYRPTLYQEGSTYCCFLGPDAETGVFGRGNTPAEAFADFDRRLKKLKDNPVTGDEVSDFVQHRHV